jgi:hypothetical protein
MAWKRLIIPFKRASRQIGTDSLLTDVGNKNSKLADRKEISRQTGCGLRFPKMTALDGQVQFRRAGGQKRR